VWPKVASFLEDALTSSPEFPDWYQNYNIHHLQMFLTNGTWLLLVAVEDGEIRGACTVSFANYPLHRVAFITAIGGKLIAGRETFEQLKGILKQRGATKIQGYGRESIVRLWQRYGFEPRLTLVEAEL
jgi:hypothetical protein